MTPAARRAAYTSWNPYQGEGRQIVEPLARLFEKKYKRSADVVSVSQGVYHGGDWIIGVTVRVGYKSKFPETFYGIRVMKFYDGLTGELKRKLATQYNNDISRFIDGEIGAFKKCFNFLSSPGAKRWLVDFVRNVVK